MKAARIGYFIWFILLFLIFLRPFISEHAFLRAGILYVSSLIFFSFLYLVYFRGQIITLPRLRIWPALFIATILFSIIIVGSTPWSLLELYFFVPNILIFYIASEIKPYQQKQLFACILFSACIISTYAIYQYFIGMLHAERYLTCVEDSGLIEKVLKGRRVFGTFVSPNVFASYILTMLFVGIGYLSLVKKRRKVFYSIAVVLMALSLFYTKSIGGLLTGVVTFLIFTCCVGSQANFRKRKIILVCFSIILLLVIIASIYRFLPTERLSQFLNFNDPNNSIIQRTYYWQASIDMIKDRPFFGIGWRQFGLLYELYKSPEANISHYSHNVFLQILAELGPIGLASFILLVAVFLRDGIRVIQGDGEEKAMKIALFFAGCAFLIHNIVDLSFYFGQVAFFWWMILGLLSNYSAKENRHVNSRNINRRTISGV
jgi:O-antigen ligase